MFVDLTSRTALIALACIAVAPNASAIFLDIAKKSNEHDPRSACNFDPLWRRVLAVALAPSELVGVAGTARARVVG